PRNGNFDIYVATLDAAGKDALKRLSSQTDLSPALASTGQAQATGAQAPLSGGPSSQPSAAAQPNSTVSASGILPAGVSPYVVALAGLAVVWAGVEGMLIARRRSKRRATDID